MLTDRDRIHLEKLLEIYTFTHLRPSPEVYEINIPVEEHFVEVLPNVKKRKIYYRVNYTEQEEERINQVRQQAMEAGVFQKFPSQIILKHLSAVGYGNIKKCLERLLEVQAFLNNETITTLTKETIRMLESGAIYTYGHDKNMKPLVIIRADRFDFSKTLEENFNCVYFLMLVVLGFRTVPYHAEKYICIFDLNNMTATQVPYKYLYSVLNIMNLVYCGNVERTFICNASGISSVWNFIKGIFNEYTRSKITFISESNSREMLRYIDPFELEKKYGGKLENLTQYWPPKCTNEEFDAIQMLKNDGSTQTEDEFYSVCNDTQFFIEKEEGLCGSTNCNCRLF